MSTPAFLGLAAQVGPALGTLHGPEGGGWIFTVFTGRQGDITERCERLAFGPSRRFGGEGCGSGQSQGKGFELYGGRLEQYHGHPAPEAFAEGLAPVSTTSVTATLVDGRRVTGRLLTVRGDQSSYFVIPYPTTQKARVIEARDGAGHVVERISVPT